MCGSLRDSRIFVKYELLVLYFLHCMIKLLSKVQYCSKMVDGALRSQCILVPVPYS